MNVGLRKLNLNELSRHCRLRCIPDALALMATDQKTGDELQSPSHTISHLREITERIPTRIWVCSLPHRAACTKCISCKQRQRLRFRVSNAIY